MFEVLDMRKSIIEDKEAKERSRKFKSKEFSKKIKLSKYK